MSQVRYKSLLIGGDVDMLYSYHKYHTLVQDRNIVGIIYCHPLPPPTRQFQGIGRRMLRIYSIYQLEKIIIKKKIHTCFLQCQNIPNSELNSLMYRITSIGNCDIEFISSNLLSEKPFKPLISITSMIPGRIHHTFTDYICNILAKREKKVIVILFRPTIPSKEIVDVLELSSEVYDENSNLEKLDERNKERTVRLLRSGAKKVIITPDISRSIIIAEQHSDIVLLEAEDCEVPQVIHKKKICLTKKETVLNHNNKNIWPGLINANDSDAIIVLTDKFEKSDESDFNVLFKERQVFFFGNSQKGAQNDSSKIEPHRHRRNSDSAARLLKIIEKPQFKKTEIEFVDLVEYNSGGFEDYIGMISERSDYPILRDHFVGQVDLINVLAFASTHELHVSNNESSNREAFCRLFLSGHIPPGYRVTTGEIIDPKGNLTGQLDVVIVNDYSPRMTSDESGAIIGPILADTVLGVIEVKTSLTPHSLQKALSQLRPVRALMPTHTTLSTLEGKIVPDPLGGKVLTGIFSFRDYPDTLERVEENLFSFPNVADFIVVVGLYGFFSLDILKVCNISTEGLSIISGYAKFEAKGMELAVLFGIYNSIASMRRFSGMNYIKYLVGEWDSASSPIDQVNNKSIEKFVKDINKTGNITKEALNTIIKASRTHSDGIAQIDQK